MRQTLELILERQSFEYVIRAEYTLEAGFVNTVMNLLIS
jgi:hypothetical protein